MEKDFSMFECYDKAKNYIETCYYDHSVYGMERANEDDFIAVFDEYSDSARIAYRQAWKDHCKDRRRNINMAVKGLMKRFMWYFDEGSMTKEEFDEILKENGLMRIPKESNED